MTEVDFYVLDDSTDDDAVLRAACRLAHEGWDQGQRVYVLSTSDGEAARMDDLLWTFAQDSFVPHERLDGTQDPDPLAAKCVLIGTSSGHAPAPDLLINLGASVPGWFTQCSRVVEIVAADPQRKAEGRQRYRTYRDQGVPLRTHEIRAR